MVTALIYHGIDAYSSTEFIKTLDEAEANDEEVVVRINSNGGAPSYGYGMIARLAEYKGKKSVKVDGKAFSMGAFICAACENVEALDVAEFMIHRAAYPAWFEKSESFTEELKANLERTNKSLKTMLESKIDVEALKAIIEKKKDFTGSYKDIWSMETRLDLFLTAAEAKKVGLVNKVVKLTKQKVDTVNAHLDAIAASYNVNPEDFKLTYPEAQNEGTKETPQTAESTNIKTKKMTVQEIKAQHPEAYAEIVKEVTAEATAKERQRVAAWSKFREADAKLVDEAIKSGENYGDNQETLAELNIKMIKAQQTANMENQGKQEAGADGLQTKSPEPKTEGEEENVLATAASNLDKIIKGEL